MFINFIFLSGLVLSKMVYCSWNETGHSLSSDDEMAMKEKNQLIDHLIENKDYTSSESESNEIKKGMEYFDEAKDTPPEHKNIWEAICDQDIKAVDYLIRIEQKKIKDKKDNSTLLNLAVFCGNVEIVKYLVSKSPDINASLKDSITPLHLACWNANLDIVKYFISELKMDPNSKGKNNSTCLHQASRYGNVEIVKYLVSKGADINARNNYSFLPLHWACACGNLKIVKYFISELKMDPNLKGSDNETCLHKAVDLDNLELVEFLIENGAKESLHEKNNNQRTPLEYAEYREYNENEELIEYLKSQMN